MQKVFEPALYGASAISLFVAIAIVVNAIGKLYRVNEYEKYKAGVDKQILSLKRELDKYTNKSGDNPYDR